MKQASEILDRIQRAERIVITSHRSPDGDSVGSSLAMLRFIRSIGKDAQICHPDPAPDFLEWIKQDDIILNAEQDPAKVEALLKSADLLFAMDYNDPNRMGSPMAEWFIESESFKIMLDHHMFPGEFFDISVSHPEVCSTAQLVFEFIESSGCLPSLNVSTGAAIYLGLVTDTGSFRFGSVTPKTHRIVAHLLEIGVDHAQIHEATFDTNRVDKIRLRSYIIAERLEVIPAFRVAIISVTMEEMQRFHYVKGDTEGLVNTALSLEGVDVAVFFAEKEDGVKISFRSKAHVSVNSLAMEHFKGGGHKNAAGGASDEGLNETIERFKGLLGSYFHA